MYIKSLDINGFKSFANRTQIVFLPPSKNKQSVTAIVGPNGSGKSNVSDAIRWVLGEQSMKQLRGKKSHDIIFSGSEHKGKMGSAQVSFVLDNSDNRIPVDYEEVVITRKIYRSGESEYLLNGNTIRLLDLQLLLAKAQFGQGSYSVIGQGTIAELLLQSAADRKTFFDEAVGIKEFQMKRHQALLKLNKTDEHMKEAELVLTEITPRLKTLSRQVKKLEERHELELRLKELQEEYYVTLWSYNENELQGIKNELQVFEDDFESKQKELAGIQEELASLAKESTRDAFHELQNKYQGVLKEKTQLERDRAEMSGRLQTQYAAAGKQNIGWLENKIEELRSKLVEFDTEATRLEADLEMVRETIAQKEKELEGLMILRTELQGQLNTLEQKVLNLSYQASLHQFTGLKAVESILENKNSFGTVYGAVAELARTDRQFQVALDIAASGQLSSIVVDNEKTAENCIHFLREHQLGFATFLPLTKIRPRPIPQDIENILSQAGVYGLAKELAEYDEQFENIFSYILGSTVVVKNIHIAREIGIGRVRMVTLEGDILELSGAMKGGFRRSRSQDLSFGRRTGLSVEDGEEMKKEIEKIKAKLQRVSTDIEAIQIEMNTLNAKLSTQQNKLEFLNQQKQGVTGELSHLEQELSLTSMSEEEYGVAMSAVHKQKEELDKRVGEKEGELVKVQQEMDEFNRKEEEKKARVFSLQDQMQSIQLLLNDITGRKNEKNIAIARLETKLEDIDEEVYREMRESIHKIKERIGTVLELTVLDATQTEIQKIKYKLQLIGGIDEEIVEEYEEIKARHEGLSEQLNDLKKAHGDLETLIEELDKLMKTRRAKAFKEIRKEFHRYFSLLFEGGKADLVEIYNYEDEQADEELGEGEVFGEDDEEKKSQKKRRKILTGIDVMACPPGKKIENIQALSGGERTMTSIALVCAILHTNPPPFVILDEVEAALDEANTLRFTKILQELSEKSQFVLITHNRATMHAADALYGVTMGNDGISKLLSVKLEQAQKSVE
ncbi:MAG: hypothetical protein COV59_01350 [Candidatus Magasanikbacteria bacterium CG11_big_fil_rev_8_21_14_0_20_39_34]|uniref:Chromosome partition protein Smc n=1 Tax=Candidatus Magasanikbacteria bacterium CG11_big_fil_rev_8_21_14_0_20_39_34 TaxID=1974653 RepID=A0A2H0N648_9BACT|nr:MAG: hypothetical protein COV59_01350 [Candidatus Magasanikbacteria bacterium CG11_big_fil_rev_8_21_14_0_20_39_34]